MSGIEASFQAAGPAQGKRFAEDCDELLQSHGYRLGRGSFAVHELGIEVDREAISPKGTLVWFEYKGSIRGSRPGLLRTDTLKKAIANGALVASLENAPPFVVLASHVPTDGAGAAMLRRARLAGYLTEVVRVYDDPQVVRRVLLAL
jgi:hypothetical protein